MGIINSAAANQDKQSGQGAADKLNNGLSPNGKATDSDSVIFKVRILVAQFNGKLWFSKILENRSCFFAKFDTIENFGKNA